MGKSLPDNARAPRDTWDSVTPSASPERANFREEDHLQYDSEKAENPQEIIEKVRCLVDKSTKEREYAEKTNKRWYPVILFMIAINFFLWIAMCYAVFDAEKWSNDRPRYLAYTWLLFFVPLLAVSFFIFSPWPKAMRAGRDTYSAGRVSPQWKNFVNAFSAIACFIIIVVYIYTNAIPDYNNIDWEMTVNFTNTLEIPTFAFIIQHTGENYQNSFNYTTADGKPDFDATLFRQGQIVRYPSNSLTEVPLNYAEINSKNGEIFWVNRTAFVANTSLALKMNTTGAPTAMTLTVALNGTFNSSVDPALSIGPPNLEIAVFDPRMQLEDMLYCGLIPWMKVTPFASSYMSMSMMHIIDQLQTIHAPTTAAKYCTRLYRGLMAQTEPPFAFYEPRLTGNMANVRDYTQDCDIARNPNASCATSVALEYGTQFVLSRMTQRGTTTLNIWTNAGALVGAIQFFAWFWLQAVGG